MVTTILHEICWKLAAFKLTLLSDIQFCHNDCVLSLKKCRTSLISYLLCVCVCTYACVSMFSFVNGEGFFIGWLVGRLIGSIFLFPYWDTVSRSPGWFLTHYVDKDNLKLLILLTPPPKCLYYRHVSPCQTCTSFLFFFYGFWCQVEVLMLARQALYSLNQLSCLVLFLFYFYYNSFLKTYFFHFTYQIHFPFLPLFLFPLPLHSP